MASWAERAKASPRAPVARRTRHTAESTCTPSRRVHTTTAATAESFDRYKSGHASPPKTAPTRTRDDDGNLITTFRPPKPQPTARLHRAASSPIPTRGSTAFPSAPVAQSLELPPVSRPSANAPPVRQPFANTCPLPDSPPDSPRLGRSPPQQNSGSGWQNRFPDNDAKDEKEDDTLDPPVLKRRSTDDILAELEERRLEKDDGSIADEHACPICMELLLEPVVLPGCSHAYCELCVARHILNTGSTKKPTCAQCRNPFPTILPEVERTLKGFLMQTYPRTYEERADETAADVEEICPALREKARAERTKNTSVVQKNNSAAEREDSIQRIVLEWRRQLIAEEQRRREEEPEIEARVQEEARKRAQERVESTERAYATELRRKVEAARKEERDKIDCKWFMFKSSVLLVALLAFMAFLKGYRPGPFRRVSSATRELDPYEILGVTPLSTIAEVKAAYSLLRKKTEDSEKLDALAAAYEEATDKTRRATDQANMRNTLFEVDAPQITSQNWDSRVERNPEVIFLLLCVPWEEDCSEFAPRWNKLTRKSIPGVSWGWVNGALERPRVEAATGQPLSSRIYPSILTFAGGRFREAHDSFVMVSVRDVRDELSEDIPDRVNVVMSDDSKALDALQGLEIAAAGANVILVTDRAEPSLQYKIIAYINDDVELDDMQFTHVAPAMVSTKKLGKEFPSSVTLKGCVVGGSGSQKVSLDGKYRKTKQKHKGKPVYKHKSNKYIIHNFVYDDMLYKGTDSYGMSEWILTQAGTIKKDGPARGFYTKAVDLSQPNDMGGKWEKVGRFAEATDCRTTRIGGRGASSSNALGDLSTVSQMVNQLYDRGSRPGLIVVDRLGRASMVDGTVALATVSEVVNRIGASGEDGTIDLANLPLKTKAKGKAGSAADAARGDTEDEVVLEDAPKVCDRAKYKGMRVKQLKNVLRESHGYNDVQLKQFMDKAHLLEEVLRVDSAC